MSPDATAFSNRGAGFFYHSVVLWTDPEEDAEQIGTRTYERLVALKQEFDPTNVFRLNHNIAPSASPS